MTVTANVIRLRQHHIDKSFFKSWEMILIYIFVAINILLMSVVPDIYFAGDSFQTIVRSGMDLSIMVLGMVFILILGEIDISVASIMILSAMVIGVSCRAGVPEPIAVIFGIMAGATCGLINGLLVALMNMPSVIVTIATSLAFRGLVRVVLKDSYLNTFPHFFVNMAWDDIGGIIPVSMIIFLALAVIFGVVLHKSEFGRKLYIIGNSKDVAKYSGIKVKRIRVIAFVIMGVTAALSSMIFVGRLDGITFSMGTGYELKVIAIAVLGGVSTLGGKGKIYGPIIATFIMAFLSKSLDLFQVHPNVQKIVIGIVLVLAVLIPRINRETFTSFTNKFKSKEIRRLESADVSYNINQARQTVIGKRSHRMSKREFLPFLRKMPLTSTTINFNSTYSKLKKAKFDYHEYKAKIRKIKKDSPYYQDALKEFKEREDKYNKLKVDLALCNDLSKVYIRTCIELIDLNTKCVIDEINDSVNRNYEGYQYKSASIDNFEKYRKDIKLTYWDVKSDITRKMLFQFFYEALIARIKANHIYLRLHKERAVELTNESDRARIIYSFSKAQSRIAKYHYKQRIFFDKSLIKLRDRMIKENNHENK